MLRGLSRYPGGYLEFKPRGAPGAESESSQSSLFFKTDLSPRSFEIGPPRSFEIRWDKLLPPTESAAARSATAREIENPAGSARLLGTHQCGCAESNGTSPHTGPAQIAKVANWALRGDVS